MLYEDIKSTTIATMKAGGEDKAVKLNVLRMLKSAIDSESKDTKAEITDSLVEKVLVRELKKRQEAMDAYLKAGAQQQFAVEQAEAVVIKMFLPEQLDAAEVSAKIDEVITMIGPNIGLVMKEMKTFVGARFPGKDLADMVKNKIAQSK